MPCRSASGATVLPAPGRSQATSRNAPSLRAATSRASRSGRRTRKRRRVRRCSCRRPSRRRSSPWCRKGRRAASAGADACTASPMRRGRSASRPNGGAGRNLNQRATTTSSRTKPAAASGSSAKASIARRTSRAGSCTASSHDRLSPPAPPSPRSRSEWRGGPTRAKLERGGGRFPEALRRRSGAGADGRPGPAAASFSSPAALGLKAIGIADRNTMAGVVRAYSEWKNHKDTLKLLVGTRLVTTDDLEAIAYPIDREAYGRLCRLLSTGNRRAKKGECLFGFDEILAAAQGQVFIAVPPPRPSRSFTERLSRLRHAAPSRTYLAAVHRYRSDEPRRLGRLAEFAERAKVPLVAVGDALYHLPERRLLQDVVTCIGGRRRIVLQRSAC